MRPTTGWIKKEQRSKSSVYSARKPWMKHQRKRLRAQGVAEIASQLEEGIVEQRLQSLIGDFGTWGQSWHYKKDRSFAAWWDALEWYDDVKLDIHNRQYNQYMDDLLSDYHHDDWDDSWSYRDPNPDYEYLVGYDPGYGESASLAIYQYQRSYDETWSISSIDELRNVSIEELDRRIAKNRRYLAMYGGQPSNDPMTREWLHDWLLGRDTIDVPGDCNYLRVGDAMSAYYNRSWEEMDGEEEFFEDAEREKSWYQRSQTELPCDRIRADEDRNQERLRAMSRFRGKKAA